MKIQRTKDGIIIRLPVDVDTDGLQEFINLLAYKEATVRSKATQEAVDELASDAKKGRWLKQTEMLNEIKDLTKSSIVDLSNFKFDRDEANDYSG
jgi:hypothetical protein